MGFIPKDYVGVHTRVEKFHAEHKENMGIDTEFKLDGKIAIFKATVITSKGTFTGSSFGELGKEKAFEKLETVAVGRALAFAGYEVKSGIASSEENEEWEKKQEEELPWFGDDNLLNIRDLVATGQKVTLKDVKKNYRIAKRYNDDLAEILTK